MGKVTPYLFMLLLFIGGAYALSCDVDNAPFIIDANPKGLCVAATNASGCVTWLSDPENSTNVWGSLPRPSYVEGVGFVDTFKLSNYKAMVEFSKEHLYHNVTVTANVRCGVEQYSFNMTPQLADFNEIPEAVIYAGDTAFYIIIVLLLAFVLTAIYYAMRKNL